MENTLRSILSKTIQNSDRMARYITDQYNIAYNEVGKICGLYNITRNIYNMLLVNADLTEQDVKDFIKKTPTYGWVTTNPFYALLVIYVLTFMSLNKEDNALTTVKYYALVTASTLLKKYFAYCNPDLFIESLNRLKTSSMCKGGIRPAAIKVATDVFNIYKKNIVSEVNPYIYFRLIIDIRTRLNQAIKHIAVIYYNLLNKEQNELSDEALLRIISQAETTVLAQPVRSYIAHQIHEDPDLVAETMIVITHSVNYTSLFYALCKYMLQRYTLQQIRNSTFQNNIKRFNIRQTRDIIDSFIDIENERQYKIIIAIALFILLQYR